VSCLEILSGRRNAMKNWNVGVKLTVLMLVMSPLAGATPQCFPGTGHYYDVIADFTDLS
jgi:hypothetical protein